MMNAKVRAILDGDELLTPEEVATRFSVARKTVTRWAGAGRIIAIKLPGGQYRFSKKYIDAYLQGEFKS